MKRQIGEKDGAPREGEPVSTVASRMEFCVKGVKSVDSFDKAGLHCDESE